MATARSGAMHVATDILNPISFNPDAEPIIHIQHQREIYVRSAYAEMTRTISGENEVRKNKAYISCH